MNGYAIKMKGQWLDLLPDQILSFELNNPAYLGDDVDVIEGAFSFPIELPLTGPNRQLLKYPDRLDSQALFIADEAVEVWVEGFMLFPALATISESKPGRANMTMLVSSIAKLKDTALTDVDYGGIVTMGSTLAETLAHAKDTALNPANYNHVFYPIHNPAIVDDTDADSETVGNWQNRFDAAAGVFTTDANDVAMPFLKLNFVLEKIFNNAGFALKNNWQVDEELRLLTVYNNFNLTNIATGDWLFSFDPKNHVSKTKAGDFLKNLCRLFNLGVFVNYFDKTAELEPLRNILEYPPRHDWTKKASADYSVTQKNTYPTRFGYPSMYDELAYFHGWTDSPLENGIPSWVIGEVEKLDDLTTADPEGHYLEKSSNLIAYWFHTPTPNWGERVIYMPVVRDADTVKFTAGFSTVWMGDATSKFPQVKVKGTIGTTKNDCPDKLIFYRGMQKNYLNQDYPMGDAMGYNAAKNVLTVAGGLAKYSLYWDRDRGIYNQWWRNWHLFLKTKVDVTRRLALNIRDLVSFGFQDKVQIENQHFFVKKLRFSIGSNGLRPTEATLIRI